MNLLMMFVGGYILLVMLVVVTKLRVSNTLGVALRALVYTGLAALLWIALLASGAGLVTPSIVVVFFLASFVPAFEWARSRS